MKTIAMKCASCGAGLQIAPDMGHFACGYCGASLNVVRQGGTVSLNLVADSIAKVQVGTDRTAAELALVRLPKDIEERRRELDAMEKRICRLKGKINMASLPSSRSRMTSIIASHAVGAIVKGGAIGLFIGFIVYLFFHAWLPASGVIVGLSFALAHAIKYFNDPVQVRTRRNARRNAITADINYRQARENASRNAEELKNLQPEKSTLNDRLQKLNGQLAAARAIVDS